MSLRPPSARGGVVRLTALALAQIVLLCGATPASTQEVVRAGPRLDDQVSTASLSATAAEGSVLDGDLRLSGTAGLVRSTLDRVRTPFAGFGDTTRHHAVTWGARLGAGLSAGWANGDGGVHSGFAVRADWITRSVVGPTALLSFSVAGW